MRATRVGLAIVLTLAAQTTLTRFVFAAGGTDIDFLLVTVVFVALSGGPVVGLWTGTVGGLLQDVLSGGIVGVSGLAKSIVGFVVGAIGSQFIVLSVWHRLLMLFVASLAHSLCFLGVYSLIESTGPVAAWNDVVPQALGNAVVGIVAVTVIEQTPGLWERARQRSGLGRRRWRTS